MKKAITKILVLGAVLIISLGQSAGCESENAFGIPNGTYHSCSEEGVVTRGAPEGAWQIKNDKAERFYLSYTITESDGKVYFKYKASSTEAARKFEVEYDSNTKILTVYMPPNGLTDGETTAFFFKK